MILKQIVEGRQQQQKEIAEISFKTNSFYTGTGFSL